MIKLKEFVASENLSSRKADYKSIDTVELKILNDIFEGKQEISTDSLKNKFYLKISGINDLIYENMVSRGYFRERPDMVRKNNLLTGCFAFMVGIGLSIGGSFVFIFTLGPSLVLFGLVKIFLSSFMPAKTALGTDIFEKAKGFRMFLYTAERFKLQKLTPEMFEKFLPYAMVYGVEKEWAKNFEDIYKEPPDWYEGRWDTFNTLILANSLTNMTHSASSVMASSPSSSGSGWSGGGWSGGGGFSGGFGGGGGGGGGGGMG